MVWITAIGIVVILAAGLSIYGSIDTDRDIKSGKPTYTSIGDRTGIWDRQHLAQLLGPPDDRDRYDIAGKQLPRRFWVRAFDSLYLDGACIAVATLAIGWSVNQLVLAGWLMAACGFYQVVSWAISIYLVATQAEWKGNDRADDS